MATRSIVTYQPDVACDVCGRRLLRGEQPDTFIAAGRRRTVCELCVPRATHEGWLRESDAHSLSLRAPRSRSARSLLDRLRQKRAPYPQEDSEEQAPHRRVQRERVRRPHTRQERDPYEDAYLDSSYALGERSRGAEGQAEARPETEEHGLDDHALLDHAVVADRPRPVSASQAHGRGDVAEEIALSGAAREEPTPIGLYGGSLGTSGGAKAERALAVFNASPYADRVAGIARSLGAPCVTVRPLGESGSRVAIVVSWELCWYRYEVDLGDELAGPQLVSEGMELEELSAEDREGNATSDERGALSLV